MLLDFEKTKPQAPGAKFEVIPPGVYRACVYSAETKESQSGKPMIVVEFVVSEGSHKAQKIKHYFVVSSETGKGVFLKFLKGLTEKAFTSFDTDTDLPKIIGKELLIRTDIEVKGGFRNARIQDFYLLKDLEQANADFDASADVTIESAYDADVPF